MKEISSPEEAAALAQELLTPMLAQFVGQAKEIEETESPAPPVLPIIRVTPTAPQSRHQTPWNDLVPDENEAMVIDLYAKGLTTRDVASYMRSHHGMELSQPGVSAITDKVYPLVKEWQARPLASCYPVMYLDGLHFKVREAGKISTKIAYIALGVNQYGLKEVLGIWTSESESAKFWMGVLNDLKNRGVEDILITCVDGLKGFPEAIRAIYPQTDIQLCIVHQVRHTIKFVPHKDREKFAADLKTIYGAPSEEAGRQALAEVIEHWPEYQVYLKSWETRWSDLAQFFAYPQPIRKMVYTTNAIENLNRQFRKVTKTTTVFPHDESLVKLLWLAQSDISKSWTMALRNWGEIVAQMSILFPDRVEF
jgi:transposase-like protein